MKITKILLASACALSLLTVPTMAAKDMSECCAKAKAANKECESKCCVEAKKAKVDCQTCAKEIKEKKDKK